MLTVASFAYANGAYPTGGLTLDAYGNLFGTTTNGTAGNFGSVFEVPAGTNSIFPLASFNGINGVNPIAPPVLDQSGNLFGTTRGGLIDNGTVYELTPGPLSFTIDTVPPTVQLAAPGSSDGSIQNKRPMLTATAADNSGGSGLAAVQFQYSADGGSTWLNVGAAQTAVPFRFTFGSPLADRSYLARALASDNAGNSTTSAAVSFIVDTVAPTSSVSVLPALEQTAGFLVSWSGQDGVGGSGIGSFDVYVSDNGASFTLWQGKRRRRRQHSREQTVIRTPSIAWPPTRRATSKRLPPRRSRPP